LRIDTSNAKRVERAVARPYATSAPDGPSAPAQARVEVIFGGSLEAAQLRKLDHLIARAQVQRSDRVLDLGFGWGGLSIRLAETVGCRVHGITLSREQHDLALERVGPMHQAGSDSLLTCAAFFRLRKSFFGGRLDERRFAGVLYGLGGAAPQALAAS
jgi:hypothetical protein